VRRGRRLGALAAASGTRRLLVAGARLQIQDRLLEPVGTPAFGDSDN